MKQMIMQEDGIMIGAFSDQELKIITIVRKKDKTIKDISDKLYNGLNAPMYPGTVVSSAIKRINMKAVYHGMTFRIDLIGTAGPSGKVASFRKI